MLTRVRSALRRASPCILVIAGTNAAAVASGLAMAHAGSSVALADRDFLVTRAHRVDPAARADDAGAHWRAAAVDFSRNLGLVAVPDTVGGLTLVLPVGLAAYRGWVGGIVSVGPHHESRLRRVREAVYYLVTLVLQLAGFTLAGGAGVHLGLAFIRGDAPAVGPRWFRLPKAALADVAWLYALVVPLLALGSVWEYLAPVR